MANVKYIFQDTNEMLSDPYIKLFLLDTTTSTKLGSPWSATERSRPANSKQG